MQLFVDELVKDLNNIIGNNNKKFNDQLNNIMRSLIKEGVNEKSYSFNGNLQWREVPR